MKNLPENISPEFILSFLKNQLGPDEAMIVQNWMDESKENHQQFEQFKMVWEETGKLIPAPVDVDVDSAWNKMSFMIDRFDEKSEKETEIEGKVIPFRKYLLRVAAVLIPFIIISGIYLLLNQKPTQITRETIAQTLEDTLSDGSVVSLNKLSKITYPKTFGGKTREVEMDGEIFFQIKPDKTKPFIIHTENVSIKVLGTSFVIKSFADSALIEVSVSTGRVLFSGPEKENASCDSIILFAGETGIYNKSTHELKKVELPVKSDLQQKGLTLVFNRALLTQVADSLSKCYGAKIIFGDEDLKKMHLSTTFKDLSIDSIISLLTNTFDLKVTKQGSNYILKQNEE